MCNNSDINTRTKYSFLLNSETKKIAKRIHESACEYACAYAYIVHTDVSECVCVYIFGACVSQYINFVGILFSDKNNFMFPIKKCQAQV